MIINYIFSIVSVVLVIAGIIYTAVRFNKTRDDKNYENIQKIIMERMNHIDHAIEETDKRFESRFNNLEEKFDKKFDNINRTFLDFVQRN